MSSLYLAALFVCLSCHGTEGRRNIYRELLRQPSVFQPKNAKYVCVDIHKQPAFDHILLKNHKIQMAPSSLPKLKNKNLKFNSYPHLESNDEGCSKGKVPIRRLKVDNLTDVIHPLTETAPGKHFAGAKSKVFKKIYGASASIGLNTPDVKMNQISAATICIEGGEGPQLNSLQVGWAVHPRIYGDHLTHLTGYWTADGSIKTGCFNALCPGFVQVHRKYYLGQAYGNFWANNNRNVTHIFVHRDKATGHWWVTLERNIHLGYWPKKLFTEFSGGANSVQFGGWTYGSPDRMSPPMGTGYFPTTNNLKQSGFFSNLKYVDDLGVLQDAHRPRQVADISNCYDAIYLGHKNKVNEQILTFGGPGGQCDL